MYISSERVKQEAGFDACL